MTLNPDIRDQAYQFFIEEAPELLQAIEAGLLTLRQERSTAKIHNIMRAAHSLKGGAASVELEAIKTIAHRLENIFKALYDETIEIDTDLESQLLQAYDCLRLPLTQQITIGHFDGEQALAIAEPIFTQIEERLGDALAQADNYLPSSSDLGFDMTVSIFEVDVVQGLELLSKVIEHPQHYQIAGELRAQAEVFAGFAELLNLPGFGAIAQTTIAALDAHPNRALEIAKLAVADFEASREAVLAGERKEGGKPSPALVELTNSLINSDTANLDTIAIADPISEPNPIINDAPSLEELCINVTEASETDTSELEGASVTDFSSNTESFVAHTEDSLPSLDDVFGDTVDVDVPDLNIIPIATSQSEDDDAENLVPTPEIETSPPLYVPITEVPETLEEAVQSITEIFDKLQPIEESTPVIKRTDSPPTLEEEAITNLTSPTSPTSPHLSVRVDSERLERMNNMVGELAINRNGLSLQNQQLQRSVRGLLDRFSRVQSMVSQLRELSDKMLIGTSSSGSITSNPGFLSIINTQWSFLNQPTPNNQQPTTNKSDFDSLELDNYGVLNSRLQGLIEDMVQLEESVDDVALFAKQSDQTLEQQRQMLTQLRDELMWARMLPLGEVLNRFPRTLRDLSTTYHKSVSLKLNGTAVLVDKAALEKLYDPLLHLLRNAFDHGIEPPEIRRENGKAEQGQIEIRAYHQGSQTIIEVKDDGQGINTERIGKRAIELGLLSPEQLATIAPHRLYDFLFEPGFSTAEQVSELSGRGVGLDVVRSQMRSLKGTISVTSSPGVGTTFTLRLPLTLTIAKLLVCFVGVTALALPSDSVEEIVIPKADQVKTTGEQRFLRWREQIVPAYRLSDLLDYACPLPETCPSQALVSVPSPTDWSLPMLVLRQEQYILALEIDRLVTEQELVIKPFGSAIAPPSFTYGCTILGDGSLIPVIDGTVLLEQLLGQTTKAIAIHSGFKPILSINESLVTNKTGATIKTAKTPTVLVVDDAVALRRTLALTLERAGCRVLQARDGREALDQLRQGLAIDLVVCDIEMPNMNGFEFLGQRRQDPQISKIPVVMLTSRSNDKHRWLARQLGATAYFTKPYLEQEFLVAIEEILDRHKSEYKIQLQPV